MFTLMVDCSGFPLEHTTYVVGINGELIATAYLPAAEIAGYASSDSRITEIKLQGMADYCYGIKEEIEKQLALEYSNNKIKVEVVE